MAYSLFVTFFCYGDAVPIYSVDHVITLNRIRAERPDP